MKLSGQIKALLTILLSLVFSASVQAQAPPVHTPDRFLPGDDAIGLAAGDQESPAIAWGQDSFLAVWSDSRAAPGQSIFFDVETAMDIYGLRLDADGNPLDTLPFVITQGRATQANPQVAWNGSHWLVVYETVDVNGTGFYFADALEGVRVAPDGQLMDTTPISVYRSPTGSGLTWALASDGEVWTVVHQGGGNGDADIMAVRISPNGIVLDRPHRLIVQSTYYLRFNFRLAYAADTYLLIWTGGPSGASAIRFDRSLNLLDSAPLTLPMNYQGTPDLAANDTGFFLIWTIRQPDFTAAIVGSPVTPSGTVLNPAGVNVSLTHEPPEYTRYTVAWDGINWRVSWSYEGTSVARVTPAGQVLDPGGIAFPALVSGPTAGSNAGDLAIVWEQPNFPLAEGADVMSASISDANIVTTPIPLSMGAPRQTHVDVATSGDGYMMVLHSDISGTNRVKAQPLDAAGNPTTSQPILLDSGDSTNGPSSLGVAWNGSLYLAVWTHSASGGIVGRRIQPDGTLLDPAPFPIMADAWAADVHALGDVFLVVGTIQDPSFEHFVYTYGARVQGSDGTVLDPTARFIGTSYAGNPAVTALGGRWLVAWTQNNTHDDPIAATMATFVNADGTRTTPFSVFPGHYTSQYSLGPSLASKGDAALLVQSIRISGPERNIVGRVINADGSMQPAFDVAAEWSNQFHPDVAWDGNQFVVVYRDQRNRTGDLDQIDSRSDLYASRVTAAGVLLDPKGFTFALSPKSETHPSVAAANGVTLLAGSVVRNEAPYAAMRVGYDLLGMGGNNWPVAVVNSDAIGGDIPLDVNFSSTGSHDPDGSISAYRWDFGDGVTATVPNPVHTYVAPGNYVVSLTVTDDLGASTTSTIHIEATPVNQPPVAVIVASAWQTSPQVQLVFHSSGSYDPDGATGNTYWTFGDGGDSYGSPARHRYLSAGTYQVTLTVWDNRGATGMTSMTVYVSTTPVLGDVNGDGQANILDIIAAAEGWNTRLAQPGYNPIVDRNNDRHITIDEVQWVAGLWTGS